MIYYLYKVVNTVNNYFYIGVHGTTDLNDGYMGSGRKLRKAFNDFGPLAFTKEILEYFETEEEMWNKEREIVNEEFIKRPDVYNMNVGGKRGWTKGYITVKDSNNNYFNVSKDDPRWISGELKHIHSGLVIVKNAKGEHFKVSVNDPRYISGELRHAWEGRKHSEKTKEKMRESAKGKQVGSLNSSFGTCWINNKEKNKKIKKEELEKYLNDGWEKGRINTWNKGIKRKN